MISYCRQFNDLAKCFCRERITKEQHENPCHRLVKSPRMRDDEFSPNRYLVSPVPGRVALVERTPLLGTIS